MLLYEGAVFRTSDTPLIILLDNYIGLFDVVTELSNIVIELLDIIRVVLRRVI
jgi:hypothetical protein